MPRNYFRSVDYSRRSPVAPMERRPTTLAISAGLALVIMLAACQGDNPDAVEVPGGDPVRGAELIVSYECGTCHYVPGIAGADGRDAPGLQIWPNRAFVAGAAPNHPDNVIAFLVNPNGIQPGSAMPDLGVSEQDARDITAYLFTIGGPEQGRAGD